MTRTITHEKHTGPGLLRLRLPAGRITVTAGKHHRRATVRLSAQRAGDDAATEAIKRTEVTQSGDRLAITVPSTGGGGVTQTVIQSGGRTFVSQHARVVTGSMVGVTITNGVVVVGNGGGNVNVITSGGGIHAEVTVPAGQRVELDTSAADVISSGPLAVLHVETGSGDITVSDAATVELETGSGDVHAAQVGTLTARTGSGDITVRSPAGSTRLRTGSGDVRVHLSAAVPLQVRTGSGDITATAARGIRIDRSGLRTGSGDITTR